MPSPDEIALDRAANYAHQRRIRDRLWQRELCPQCERHLSMCNCPDEGMWAPYDWEERQDFDD